MSPESTTSVDPHEVVNPRTGEVVDLAAHTTDQVAVFHEQLRELEVQAREARSVVSDELERRRRAAGSSAKAVVGVRYVATRSLSSSRWDVPGVLAALDDLVRDGVLPAAEAAALVPERTVRKPDGAALNALVSRLVADEQYVHVAALRACKTRYSSWSVAEATNG